MRAYPVAVRLQKHWETLGFGWFESFSAGTETKPQINQDAVRIMKELYALIWSRQYSKLITDIPNPDVAVSMDVCWMSFHWSL